MWHPQGSFATPWPQIGVPVIGSFQGSVEAFRAPQWLVVQATSSMGVATGNMPVAGFPLWPTSPMGDVMNSAMPWMPGYYWPWMQPAVMPVQPGMNPALSIVEGTSFSREGSHPTSKPPTSNIRSDEQRCGVAKYSSKNSSETK